MPESNGKKEKDLKTKDINKTIMRCFLSLKVGVIKNTKNKAYKYQKGEIGFKKIDVKNPSALLFTEPEKTTFIVHVRVENIKYGTPKVKNFFKIFILQFVKLCTQLYF